MKNLSIISSLLIGLLIFTSCSGDDDTNLNDESTLLIGKWKLTAESWGGTEENLTDCEKEQTIEFFSNGIAENYYVDNGPCSFSTITINYERNKDVLTFLIDGEGAGGGIYSTTATIEVLDKTTLQYKFISDNETGTYPASEQHTQIYNRIK